MRAARRFVERLDALGQTERARRLVVDLYGSLGHTGKGHGTDKAVMLGLLGEAPEAVDPDDVPTQIERIERERRLKVLGRTELPFDPSRDLSFHRRKTLPAHPNGMRFRALCEDDQPLLERTYYSVGGGFVVDEDRGADEPLVADDTVVPHPFATGDALLAACAEHGLSISTLMLANESVRRPKAEVRRRLLHLWEVIQACIRRGCEREGVLPGGLRVRRRAATLHRRLRAGDRTDGLHAMDWVNLFALAVNEENAAGGRVVTAPTNGAAGVIPAVLSYHVRFCAGADDDSVVRFLLTAGAIGILYKMNASISGAEVGCQGEVGVACSMAAAGLAEVLGGTPAQVENAAEIGMEHNLGLTCDPVGGLVQVPCIERNAMGAVKAINAARLALQGDGAHKVSLDRVIATMRQTGADMKTKYKETARGGLAVNIIEC
jgi:L-serine dehydratase